MGQRLEEWLNDEETEPAVQRGLDCFGNQHEQPTSTPTEPDGDHAVNRRGSILGKKQI